MKIIFALLITTILMGCDYQRSMEPNEKGKLADYSEFYKGPDSEYKKMEGLTIYDSIQLIKYEGDFARIKDLKSGTIGYVASKNLNRPYTLLAKIYFWFAFPLGWLLVRPPLMNWYNGVVTIMSSSNIIDYFFKAIGQRILWEAFVLGIGALVGIFGGWAIYILMLIGKMKQKQGEAQ